jgi:hypothetical protein
MRPRPRVSTLLTSRAGIGPPAALACCWSVRRRVLEACFDSSVPVQQWRPVLK